MLCYCTYPMPRVVPRIVYDFPLTYPLSFMFDIYTYRNEWYILCLSCLITCGLRVFVVNTPINKAVFKSYYYFLPKVITIILDQWERGMTAHNAVSYYDYHFTRCTSSVLHICDFISKIPTHYATLPGSCHIGCGPEVTINYSHTSCPLGVIARG